MKHFSLLLLLGSAAFGIYGASQAFADSSDLQALNERASNSATILDEYMGDSRTTIPDSLLRRAQCIVVVPTLVKVGFVVAVEEGKGLASCRTTAGWSTPSFTTIAGGSFGFQAGLEATDLVLVFMNGNSPQSLAAGNFTVSGDASVAVGPSGRDAQAGTDYQLKSEIYTYSRSRGVFAGISLAGSVIDPSKDDNEVMYGSGATASQLLTSPSQSIPSTVGDFQKRLNRYSPTSSL